MQLQNVQYMGIDWNGPLPTSEENIVHCNAPCNPLQEQEYQDLRNTIDPLEPSCEYGIELYNETLAFVVRIMNT